MTGSVQVKKGYWYIIISYKDELGVWKTKWVSTNLTERGNKKAAKDLIDSEIEKFSKELEAAKHKIKSRRKIREIDKNLALKSFSDYCIKYVDSIKAVVAKSTYRGHMDCCTGKIKDFFDGNGLRLIDITEEEIENFYDYLKGLGLKNVTIKHYDTIIRPALKRAYKDGLIPDNPYDFIETLKREKTNMKFYDKDEMSKLFDVIKGDRFELAIKVAVYYGLRRSELVGLRWSAIDFNHKTVTINHRFLVVNGEPDFSDFLKTQSSYRTYPLLPELEELFIKHKEELTENIEFYGNTYDDRFCDYVFVHENGKIIYPEQIYNEFIKIQERHNLKRIRLHDLRHSCASLMLASGVHMKQIQDWLGHSNYSTTADIYSHLDYSSKLHSANAISNLLTAANQSKVTSALLDEKIKNELKDLYFESIEKYLSEKTSGGESGKTRDDEMFNSR